MTNDSQFPDIYLSPGTKVVHESVNGILEYGVIVYCWISAVIKAYDCYVAFFGEKMPDGEPDGKPYILRYAVTSLRPAMSD